MTNGELRTKIIEELSKRHYWKPDLGILKTYGFKDYVINKSIIRSTMKELIRKGLIKITIEIENDRDTQEINNYELETNNPNTRTKYENKKYIDSGKWIPIIGPTRNTKGNKYFGERIKINPTKLIKKEVIQNDSL